MWFNSFGFPRGFSLRPLPAHFLGAVELCSGTGGPQPFILNRRSKHSSLPLCSSCCRAGAPAGAVVVPFAAGAVVVSVGAEFLEGVIQKMLRFALRTAPDSRRFFERRSWRPLNSELLTGLSPIFRQSSYEVRLFFETPPGKIRLSQFLLAHFCNFDFSSLHL